MYRFVTETEVTMLIINCIRQEVLSLRTKVVTEVEASLVSSLSQGLDIECSSVVLFDLSD